jgi:DNA polymerase bacteriophage-type
MADFHLDWETRSVLLLDEVGLDVYLAHPSTKIIMAQYAYGDRVVKLWEPHLNPQIPEELENALLCPFTIIHAWGTNFERQVAKRLLGIDKPLEEWVCTMANARYAGVPGKLHDAGEVLELGIKAKKRYGGGKTGKGSSLIKLFCEPVDVGGKETLFGISEPTFNTPYTHPLEWAQFRDYGIGDVEAEREAEKKLAPFVMSEEEIETWRLDSKINETGWPVDSLVVHNAREIALRTRTPLLARMKELTGADNPESRDQILNWVSTQGYLFESLGKEFIARALGGDCTLTPEGREVLELRLQTAKSSIAKYTALADMTAVDGRLRYQYTYYGAHTGRWAAHGVNVGNLLKPTKAVEKKLDLAINLVRKMDYEGIVREFGRPLDVAAGVQRSAFRAPAGYKFVVADLNAIENRVLGYLTRCEPINQVFKQKFTYHGPPTVEYGSGKPIVEGMEFDLDPYIQFATRMYNMSYHDLWCEWKIKGDSSKRTFCKPPVLGGGYALGPGEERTGDNGLKYWTGLQGYARNMGIELPAEVAVKSIAVLRQEWKEVTWLWKDMERAAAFAIRHPGHLTRVGVPELQWEFKLFERLGRSVLPPVLHFKCHSDKVLEMILPSGRPLYYWSPRVETQHKTWTGIKDGREVTREYEQDVVFYKAKAQKTGQWTETKTFGGHLVENGTQGEARDILVDGMKEADRIGFQMVGHTYDELVTLVPITSGLGSKELCACMSKQNPRYNGLLLLAAEGSESEVYRKN